MKNVLIEAHELVGRWPSEHYADFTLTLVQRPAQNIMWSNRLAEYDVFLGPTRLGSVYKTMVTRERRTKGRMYVDRRWQSPGWKFDATDSAATRRRAYAGDWPTRKAAAIELAREMSRDQPELFTKEPTP